jgi:hypothetical protein
MPGQMPVDCLEMKDSSFSLHVALIRSPYDGLKSALTSRPSCRQIVHKEGGEKTSHVRAVLVAFEKTD